MNLFYTWNFISVTQDDTGCLSVVGLFRIRSSQEPIVLSRRFAEAQFSLNSPNRKRIPSVWISSLTKQRKLHINEGMTVVMTIAVGNDEKIRNTQSNLICEDNRSEWSSYKLCIWILLIEMIIKRKLIITIIMFPGVHVCRKYKNRCGVNCGYSSSCTPLVPQHTPLFDIVVLLFTSTERTNKCNF